MALGALIQHFCDGRHSSQNPRVPNLGHAAEPRQKKRQVKDPSLKTRGLGTRSRHWVCVLATRPLSKRFDVPTPADSDPNCLAELVLYTKRLDLDANLYVHVIARTVIW